jgi:hypothetical protein
VNFYAIFFSAACLSFRFKPVLVCLALAVDSLLVEFIGTRGDLGRAIDRLLLKQGGFCRIEDPIGEQLHAIVNESPDQSVSPNEPRPLPAERRHE